MDWLSPIAATIGTALLSILTAELARRQKQVAGRLREQREQFIASEIERLAALANARRVPPHRLLLDEKGQSDPPASWQTGVNQQVDDLSARVTKIENRLPSEEVLERVATANEAALAKMVEMLQSSVTRLEDRTLTKWDVATVVFGVLSALGALLAAAIALGRVAA